MTSIKYKIIGVTGRKRHGKDVVADYLVKAYGYKKHAFAYPIKNAVHELFGFNNRQLYGDLKEVKDEFWGVTPRVIFQYLGTDVFRIGIQKIIPHIEDNFWIKNMERYINSNSDSNIVISDIRFQNEVDLIKKMGGYIIRIIRPKIDNNKFSDHISETGIDNLTGIDGTIFNIGTLEQIYGAIDFTIS